MEKKNWLAQRREHEYGLAASVFVEPEKLVKLGTLVHDDAFHDRFYSAIFLTGVALYTAGQLTNGRLRGQLRSKGFLDVEGELREFRSLKDSIATQAEWHAHELSRMYALERMQVLLANLHIQCQELSCDPADLQQRLSAGMEAISVNETELWESAGQVSYRVYKRHQSHFQDSGSGPIGLSTGMRHLDKYTGGYFPQQLWQIAARSYFGKTTFVLDLVKRLIERPEPVGVYFASYEMSNEELQERMLASSLEIPLGNFTQGTLLESDLPRLLDHAADLDGVPLLMDESPPATVAALAARLKLARQDNDIRVLVVDHIQQIPLPRGVKRHEHLAQLARDFKSLAKDLKMTVIILNQLNAESQKKDGKHGPAPEPTNLHFSEGKAVIESLDVSLLLHRASESDSEMKVIISKNKKGPAASFFVEFDGAYQQVRDVQDIEI